MKLYLAVSYLNRGEWAGDTVWASARNGFELCLRQCVKNEGGDTIAAHVSLYFENATARAKELVKPYTKNDTPDSFFIDILSNGNHTVSVFEDPNSWYRQWSSIRVELFQVVDRFKERDLDVEAALRISLQYLHDHRAYDCYVNCNSICPLWPTKCSPSCGCCCPCVDGTNCVESVIVGIAAGFGESEWSARKFLGLKNRVSLAARLPYELRDELVASGAVVDTVSAMVTSKKNNTLDTAAIPLLLIR
jgi:hypothetical protein